MRGAAPCACRAGRCEGRDGALRGRRCARPCSLHRQWGAPILGSSCSPDFFRAFWGTGGATEKSARPWRMFARRADPRPFFGTAAAAAGGAAQLRGRENPSKIGRLAHYNFAPCGVGGRWRARALHACMCARALEMPFSSTFSAAAGVTELLRGWDVAQRLARLALSNVAERGMGSRGRVGCGAFAM